MDSARFRRIEELYHSALEREPDQRDSFLQQACGNDAELRREVKALLAKDVSTDALVDRSAWAGAGEFAERHSILSPGEALGPYEIAGVLGSGGMGDVYRARDTRLGRQVAIKVCRERFSDRFEREARTISALNHPNICTLYDIGPNYLVMELVEGETLRDWLRRAPGESAPTPRDRKMEIARQVLEALRAAHAAGIVHRDLKPANIMIRADGYVKVLDFGLAKRLPAASEAHGESTETLEISHPGQIAGTIAYMSPEQILGQPAGPRSDLFAFGVILHEMLMGRHPWPRGSAVDMLHAILHDDPPSVSSVGAKFTAIVHKLLRKTPAERYPSAEAVLEALDSPSPGEAAIPKSLTSIAVLPFLFLNEVEGHEALTIGFADALITMLGSLEEVAVRPTSAIVKYTAGTDPAQVCRDLSVRYTLQGNIQKFGVRWRASVQLFDAAVEKVAFSSKHGFEIKDVFDAQDELGRRVVESLQGHLPLTLRRARDRYSNEPRAFDEFMSGLQESYSGQQEILVSAAGHLAKAVDIDPAFPIAHATLALVSAHLYFEFDPRRTWFDKADYHCREALSLDPALAEGHLARASILWSPAKNFQHAETIAALERALEAQPNLEGAHNRMSNVCWHIGRNEEARIAHERAQQLNPKARSVNPIWVHVCNGDFARAVEVAEAGLKQAPDNRYFLNCSAYSSLLAGDLGRAEERVAEGLRLWPEEPLFIGSQGMLHALRGENTPALECVRRALDSPRSFGHTHHVHNQIADIYAAIGDADKAMGWLERTADTGFPCWPFFLVDPFLESLRGKLEFKRLIDDLRRTYTALKIQRL